MSSSIPSISHVEALDIALCYGWIDGLRRGLDDTHFLQKFTPRQAKSAWSAINKKKVAALIKAGRMQEAGKAAISAFTPVNFEKGSYIEKFKAKQIINGEKEAPRPY